MALALSNATLLVSTISFEGFELEFILDLEGSVRETSKRYGGSAPQDVRCEAYLDGSISFRSGANGSASYTLIAGQDAGPFQILLPRFIRAIQMSVSDDVSEIVPRGKLSATLSESARLANEGKNVLDAQATIQRLRRCSVVESYLGRISVYRHKDDLILEIDKMSEPRETVVEDIQAEELTSLLREVESNYHRAVFDHMFNNS